MKYLRSYQIRRGLDIMSPNLLAVLIVLKPKQGNILETDKYGDQICAY